MIAGPKVPQDCPFSHAGIRDSTGDKGPKSIYLSGMEWSTFSPEKAQKHAVFRSHVQSICSRAKIPIDLVATVFIQ
jgi:hypothetical protein